MPVPTPRAPAKTFAKPSRKSREEPPGLDAFAEGALGAGHATHIAPAVPPVLPGHDYLAPALAPAAAPAPAPAPAPRSTLARETLGMNVRFTAEEKATLLRLAEKEGRSQHQVLKRLLSPVLAAAARELDGAFA